ncbi:hypothetical protein [Streptomyces chiangmaiensis]|uniref:Uncharacterized protein n=1 Tax=Streptomyces chiangmaiensis TaxID=766497 RepID=A0ABU7FUT0_9ACTN|nr:hypothetical protein [Streptomyces chiangmaiensis]MED7827871.1 hypothetical protein [Streptomyces chiangmaiensis]
MGFITISVLASGHARSGVFQRARVVVGVALLGLLATGVLSA